MVHIKRFNESNSIESQIQDIVNESFYEFRIEYGMMIAFESGKFFEKYNFVSNREIEDIFNGPNDPFKFLPFKKSIKVTLLNEGIFQNSRLEIYTDENSNKEFEIAIKTLNSTLQDIADVELKNVPEQILPSYYSISFIITYE